MKKITIMMMTVCLCATTAIFAVDGTWNNAAGGAWETAGNWASSIIADGAGNTATFSADTGAVAVDANRTIGVFSSSAPAGFWVTGGSLVLDGGTPAIDITGGGIFMNCQLTGTSGFDKTGAGFLYLYDCWVSGTINYNAGGLGLMANNSIANADLNVNAGILYINNGVAANGKSVTVNSGGTIQPYLGTASLNAPLTLNYTDAGNTFAVQVPTADNVISLNSNITMTANTVMAVDANGSTININAPISGPFSLRLLGRSATANVGTYNINAPCTYTGWTTLESWGANPRYEIGVNQAFPAGGATTEFSLDAVNSSADTSVTLDLNDYTQRVSILWLKPDGAQSGHHVEITGNAGSVLTVNERFNMATHGNGAHAKITGGTVIVPATAEYTWLNSPVTLANATLILNASWNGAASTVIEVQNGGVVKGLNYGSLDVKSGGKVSPGNSIGSLHAIGNITMENGSEYDWEVGNGTDADLLSTDGNLDISGGITINAIKMNSTSQNGLETYRFFWINTSAGDTITGDGNDITMNYGPGLAGPEHPTMDDWGFTVTGVIPEPGIIGLLSLLGLAILRRK